MIRNHDVKRVLLTGMILLTLSACSAEKSVQNQDVRNGPPEAEGTITFTDSPKPGEPCTITVDPMSIKAMRKEWVYWLVKNNGCSDFSFDAVSINFNDNVVKTKVSRVVNGTHTIAARIADNTQDAPNGPHTYYVQMGLNKSGDPDIDVTGDCATCTIP